MLKSYLLKLRAKHLGALREQKGQSLIIFAFAILGLIAMMGLALDLGLVYIERVRISRTTDAAALASVVELPFEEESIRRSVEYIELNGYTQQDTEIRVRGCIQHPTIGVRNVGEDGTPGTNPFAGGVGGVYDENATIDNKPGGMINGYTYQQSIESPPRNIFVIDTLSYQPFEPDASGDPLTENQENCTDSGGGTPLYGTANKLRVSGQANVNMNFMQFFGFGEVPVSDQAVGENVTNLDVVVVFDVSGSMSWESNCFGCWVEDTSVDIIDDNKPYPLNGDFNPLDYNWPEDDDDGNDINIYWGGDPGNDKNPAFAGHNVCSSAPTPYEAGGYKYSVHEAEFYSKDEPIHGWEFNQRNAGQGFWVLQRTGIGSNDSYIRPHPFVTYSQNAASKNPQLQGGTYNSECFDDSGGYTGECWKTKAAELGESVPPSTPPYVEYDFTVNWAGDAESDTHIWIRAIGGTDNRAWKWQGQAPDPSVPLESWATAIYYQVDGSKIEGQLYDKLAVTGNDGYVHSNGNDLPSESNWRWVKIAHALDLDDGEHTLRLFQGSAGFYLDKIIITNNPNATVNTAIRNDGSVVGGGGGGWTIDNVLDDNGGRGPAATQGSATREACNMCNPAFGRTVDAAHCTCKTGADDLETHPPSPYEGGGAGVGCTRVVTTTNHLENDLFHGVDPMRSAQEAVKNFAARLDPKFDQIGFVTYDTHDVDRVKMQCLRWAQAHEGGSDKCYDPTVAGGPITYTNVIQGIEDQSPGGTTNIAEGMMEGLEELGVEVPGYNTGVDSDCENDIDGDNESACDRRGAARRVLVLMTDGSPNTNWPADCPGSFSWRGQVGASNDAFDCALYYAQQAADNNVIVYTIGIGAGVNRSLLTAMATGTDPDPAGSDDGFYFEGKGGKYFPAAQPDDLDAIFEQILNNIFVRIVG